MSRIALLRVTFDDAAEAARVAEQMVVERLAACASLAAERSVYRWHGEVARAEETAVLFKTATDRATALAARLKALHGYDLPVIETWPAEVDDAAARWVTEATGI